MSLSKPAKSRKGVVKIFAKMPDDIQNYFEHLPDLIDGKNGFPLSVTIAYLYSEVERAHNMTIYCGVRKLHRVDSTVARSVVDALHMKRDEFKSRFKEIFGTGFPNTVEAELKFPTKIRNKIIHGDTGYSANLRNKEKLEAIYGLLVYAKKFNVALQKIAGFKPFGSLQGAAGGGTPLNKKTSRLVLKGLGFKIS